MEHLVLQWDKWKIEKFKISGTPCFTMRWVEHLECSGITGKHYVLAIRSVEHVKDSVGLNNTKKQYLPSLK